MSLEERLKLKLAQALGDVQNVEIINEGGSCSAAAKVIVSIVSAKFEGVSRLQRHRMVHEALAEEIKNELHALTIRALAPSEL
jgi:stress-induced morphogen